MKYSYRFLSAPLSDPWTSFATFLFLCRTGRYDLVGIKNAVKGGDCYSEMNRNIHENGGPVRITVKRRTSDLLPFCNIYLPSQLFLSLRFLTVHAALFERLRFVQRDDESKPIETIRRGEFELFR